MRQLKKILMWRRSTKRDVFLLAIFIFAVYFLIDEKMQMNSDRIKDFKMVDESIRSLANQGECKIPNLPVDSAEMLSFLKDEPPIECPSEETDWVLCDKSVCKIKPSVIKKLGKITCDFQDILRTSEFKYKYGVRTRSSNFYLLKNSDFAYADCWTENRETWRGIIIGIRQNIQHRVKEDTEKALNVLMYGFDSLSKNSFIRKLPKSYKYLTSSLNADVLQGYNIVGDGTPQALIPILTGFTELELPDTRKRFRNSAYVDVYPMIWKEYQKNGYVTSFNEDIPNVGTFTYRLNGFSVQPTDHYMRTYYLAQESWISYYMRLCIGSQPRHKVMMDYTTQFMLNYETTPRFIFSFHGELSHDSINLIGVADDDITNWLMQLNKTGILNNTVLIMMSDHGNRFAEVRNTLQGKQEERLPFFSFVFPEWFKKQYKAQYDNFKLNVNRLTTPFDIHATLLDILYLPNYETVQKPFAKHSRAISLFDEISEHRSCADAFIEPHWCSCLNFVKLNNTRLPEVQHAAKTAIETINNYTGKFRKLCAQLELDEIKWCLKLTPNKDLLLYSKNKDYDGFFGVFSEKIKPSNANTIYQIQITTSPGTSIFEASVMHNVEEDSYSLKISDISRVNKYGDQAKCIYDLNPELRKYCYCL